MAFKIVSQIGHSYKNLSLSKNTGRQSLKFKAGDRLPYFEQENIYPLFTEPCFHLLHINNNPLSTGQADKLTHLFPFPVKVVEQPLSMKWQQLGVKQELFILVRPDNYMGFIFDDLDEGEIKIYLQQHFN